MKIIVVYFFNKLKIKFISLIKRDGKTYLKISDYEELRKLFAKLLSEIQRIKSEGDFEAARELVECYAVKVDAELHAEILERYERLNLAPYKGFINPQMIPVTDVDGRIVDVQLNYAESYAHRCCAIVQSIPLSYKPLLYEHSQHYFRTN